MLSCSANARSTSSRNSAVSSTRSVEQGRRRQIPRSRQIDRHDRLDAAGARGEYDDPVGERDGLVDMMGDEQHRGLADIPDVEQKALHLDAGLDVESGEGFVHQQDFRLHREGARDGDALAHAAGKLVGALFERIGKADPSQHLTRRLLALLGRHAAHGKTEADVLPDIQPGEQRCLLEDQAALWRRSGDGFAVRADRARGRLFEPGDEIEQRALAATGRAQQNDELAGLDLEIDVGQRLMGPLAPGIPNLADADAADRAGHAVRLEARQPLPNPPCPFGSQNSTRRCSSRRPKSKVKPSRPMMTMVK